MAELGFDPNVERIIERNKIKYNIHYEGARYRILKTLEDRKAAHALGRATRVWKVQKLEGESTLVGDILVMKNVWIEEGTRCEKEILDDIISKVNTVNNVGPFEPNFAKNHFILIEQDKRVKIRICDQLKDDCTSAILRGQVPPPKDTAVLLVSRKDAINAGLIKDSSNGNSGLFINFPPNPYRIGGQCVLSDPIFEGVTARQHRRILYSEYGVSLYSPTILTNHKKFLTSLAQVSKG